MSDKSYNLDHEYELRFRKYMHQRVMQSYYADHSDSDTEYDITCDTIPPQELVQMSQRHFDINLKVGSRVFPCHRNILIANSEYFRCLLSGNFKETDENIINLSTEYVDEGSFSKLLKAINGEPLKINDDISPLLVTCSYLQLTHLANKCEEYALKNLKNIDCLKLILLPQLLLDYSSLYFPVKKCICRNFGELYPKMVEIPFELLKELLECELDLLIFYPDYTLEFCKLWLHYSKHRKEMYRKDIAKLTTPFRDYRKTYIVERCEQYIKKNFKAKDKVELFLSLHERREKHPLYKKVRNYICKNFSSVNPRYLIKMPYKIFEDLFSRYYLFNLDFDVVHIMNFAHDWLNYDIENRKKCYKIKVKGLMKQFMAQAIKRHKSHMRPVPLAYGHARRYPINRYLYSSNYSLNELQ